jgi:hypothetical protein
MFKIGLYIFIKIQVNVQPIKYIKIQTQVNKYWIYFILKFAC